MDSPTFTRRRRGPLDGRLARASLKMLVTTSLLAAGTAAQAVGDPYVLSLYDRSKTMVQRADGRVTPELQASLLAALRSSQRKHEAGTPCPAVDALAPYLRGVQDARAGDPVLFDAFHAHGRELRSALLRTAAPTDACARPNADAPPRPQVAASDQRHYVASIRFGEPQLANLDGGGAQWTQLTLPGLEEHSGKAGMPGVPVWRALIGVPRGADARVRLARPAQVAETLSLNLYPFQKEPLDRPRRVAEVFTDPPFARNEQAYSTDAFGPAEPCRTTPVGRFRDLDVAMVECAAGRYNPVQQKLELFAGLDFEVVFRGGNGRFLTQRGLQPFDGSGPATGLVLNQDVLRDYVETVDFTKLCDGEELLILTPPALRAAADTLAAWKNDKGIATSVREVMDGAGAGPDTALGIDHLIESRFDGCGVRPSYVLLMGDSELLPPYRTDYKTSDDDTTGSDLGYAIVSPLDDERNELGFDLAVGRIPADNLTEASVVVDKIVGYEKTPPYLGSGAAAPFYSDVTIASQFQCCRMDKDGNPIGYVPNVFGGFAGVDQRAFIQTSETVRNGLVANGYDVQRIYTRTVDDGDEEDGQAPYGGDPTPRRYRSLANLPAPLTPGYAWSGDTQDIVDAFNDGRFLVLHRDHGSRNGWVDPSFRITDLANLSNGNLLPVVYSVNCASGRWDEETNGNMMADESFMEQLLLLDEGGMVGGLGDNRNSPTWANNALTRGFFDATWQNVAPEFGAPTVRRRLGDILEYGKLYLALTFMFPQPAGSVSLTDVRNEFVYWHVIGDPTLEMWTANPHLNTLPLQAGIELVPGGAKIVYDIDGAVITALQRQADGSVKPVGRATVAEQQATMVFTEAPSESLPLEFSASYPNRVSVPVAP